MFGLIPPLSPNPSRPAGRKGGSTARCGLGFELAEFHAMANLKQCAVGSSEERDHFKYAATCGYLLPSRPAGREGLGESGDKKVTKE